MTSFLGIRAVNPKMIGKPSFKNDRFNAIMTEQLNLAKRLFLSSVLAGGVVGFFPFACV